MNLLSLIGKKEIYKHPSALVSIKTTEMTDHQIKIMGALINNAQFYAKDNPDNFLIPIKDILELTGLECMRHLKHDEIKQIIGDLRFIIVEFNYLKKDKQFYEGGPILTWLKYEKHATYIEYTFNPKIKHMILHPMPYISINQRDTSQLKRTRAVRLYLLLKDYITSPKVPHFSIKLFRDLLGLPDDLHTSINNLKFKIIEPVVKEINDTTDIQCDYIFTRAKHDRRVYTGIQWTVAYKDGFPKLSNFKIDLCNPKQIPPLIKEEELPVEEEPKPEPPSDDLDDLLVDDGPSKPNPIVDDFDDFDILDEPKPKVKEEPDELEAFTKETPLEPLPPIIRQILQAYEFNCIAHYGHPEQEIAKFDAHYRKHGKLPKSIADALRQVGLDVSDHLDCFEEQ